MRVIRTGMAVWCKGDSFLPLGGRVIMAHERRACWWVSVCITGQHWPQVYPEADLTELATPEQAAALGMCGDCLGFGTTEALPDPMWPYAIGEIPAPCGKCGGTGRPALRLTVTRAAGTVVSHLVTLPHDFVEPAATGPPGMCLGCTCREGEAVHRDMVSVLAL
jgi:hypothetical protein